MSSKKFINTKESVVNEALDGLVMMNSSKLVRLEGTKIIRLKDPNPNQVSIICGGGSGHEPAHAGYVDPSMLTAAVCGGVFASPSHKEILTAILNVPNREGVLIVIKNYTGDVINFELAAQFARNRGIKVETIQIGEDIAFDQNKRGLAGTVLLYKMLGAAASQGMTLEKLKQIGDEIARNLQTLGISLTSCSLPGNQPTFTLADDELELGLGIHGESGKRKQKLGTAKSIIAEMLQLFLINPNTQVVALFNNLGACTDLEMNLLIREILLWFNEKNITVVRAIEGRMMTSLEMHGFSITILPVYNEHVLQLVDAPTLNKYWYLHTNINHQIQYQKVIDQPVAQLPDKFFDGYFHQLLTKVFDKLIEKTKYFNDLDAQVGDGDTGEGFERSSKACLEIIHKLDFENNFAESMTIIGEEMANTFGGTSGPLYGVLLSTGAQSLKKELYGNSLQNFADALKNGTEQIKKIGNARVGDRTMIDVLEPVSHSLSELALLHPQPNNEVIREKLTSVANVGNKNASELKAKKGRSRYQDGREVGKLDPGCEVIVTWLTLLLANL